MLRHNETARSARFTIESPRIDYPPLFKYASLRHDDDVARVKRYVACKIVACLIGAVVKSEDCFVAPTAAPPDLEPSLRGKGSKSASQGYCLHQSGFLSHYV